MTGHTRYTINGYTSLMKKAQLILLENKSVFLAFCFCLFSTFLFLSFPGKAYCYDFTLIDPNDSNIIVTVIVSPDIGGNWGRTDSNGLDHHLVAVDMRGMPITVTVTATYVGPNDGFVTSSIPNDPGSDFSKNWEAIGGDYSLLTIPEEDLLPTIDNGYETTARLNFSFFVHYFEKINGQEISEQAAINGELVLSQQLAVSASIDRFTSQMLIGAWEIIGFDGVSPLRTFTDNAHISITNTGEFVLNYDRKDEDGLSHYFITAPLSSDFDAGGYFHDVIKISASKFGVSGDIDFDAALGFAVAAGKSGIAKLLSREGALMEPRDIVLGEILHPGDTIGVISGALLILLSNGESALVTATTSTRVALGSNGIASERSYISFWMENLSYDIANDPRKYMKLALFQAAGSGTSNALPAGAHWVFKYGISPGTKYIFKFFSGGQSLKKADSKFPSTLKVISDTSLGARAVVNIFPGGPIMFHPLQGQALLDFGSNRTTLTAGGLSMGNLEADIPFISSPGGQGYSLSNVAYGLSARWFGSGGEIHTRTPALGIGVDPDPYTYEPMINPDYIEVRLNGQLVSDAGIDPVSKIVKNIVASPDRALKAGNNTLEAWLEEANRPHRHKVTGSIMVADDAFATPPTEVTALSNAARGLTIVRWLTPAYPDILGYEIASSETSSGPFTLLNSTPCSQQVWLDDQQDNPPADACWYRVRTVYENGLTGDWSAPVIQKVTEWHDGYPAFSAPANSRVTNMPGGLLIQFDDNMPGMVFWKLERGMSDNGPWEDLLHGWYVAGSGYQDTDIIPDTQYWYRLTSFSVLGDGPESTVIGSATWDGRPKPPTGLTCYLNEGTAELRWDPAGSDTVAAFRIYRDSGTGFQPVISVSGTTTLYQDRIRKTGVYDWLVKSVAVNGRESLEGAKTNTVHWISTKASGQVSLGEATERLDNGERTATVPLYRTGGAAGPLLVTVNLNQISDLGIEINGKYGGTILFADGEKSKLLTSTIDPGYHFDRFMISGIFGLNTASGVFPWPMFLPALTSGR